MGIEITNEMFQMQYDIMKDLRDLLIKQDADFEKAKIGKTPKVGEDQADRAMKGGNPPKAGPGTGVAVKSMPINEAEGSTLNDIEGSATDATGTTALSLAEEPEDAKSLSAVIDEVNGEKSDDEESEENNEEVEKAMPEGHPEGCMCEDCKAVRAEKDGGEAFEAKQLVKDLKGIVIQNQQLRNELNLLKSTMDMTIRKSVDKEVSKIAQKHGFIRTRPPVSKIDLGGNQFEDLKKSEDDFNASRKDSPEMLTAHLSNTYSFEQLNNMPGRKEQLSLNRPGAWFPTREMYSEKK